ncbi:MAG: deoxyribonuclease IV [Thermomicrobiales bacterium]|nr:deoxyribonuclease IV [Thermomicrobiales bacterium]
MLRLGAHMSIAGGYDKAVERAHSVESDALQIFTKNQNQWKAKPIDPDAATRFKAALEEYQIGPVVAHDSYLINLASPKDELWEKSIAAFRDELERCDLLGVPYLVTHPGSHTGSGTEAGIARIIEAMNRVHEEAPDIKAITLLETTAGQGSNLGSTFEELRAMLAGIHDRSRVAICFDTCHIFVAGYDIRSQEAYAETMSQFDSLIGIDQIKAIHLNDAKQPHGSKKDRHHLIGQGTIGVCGFWHLMNDARLEGVPGLLETEKGNDLAEDREAIALLRSMIGAPFPEDALTTDD